MANIIMPASEWDSHPILSRLHTRSDFDGDSARTIDNPTAEEFAWLCSITLQYKLPGKEWQDAPFSENEAFIDRMGMA